MTHAALKTIAAFLNTEGGDLLIGVADDGSIVGIERDQLENDDKFMRHLAQVVRNGLGDRAGTCIDPKTQIVQGKTVCVVSCQRSPEPVFLKWKGIEATPEGDFFVRSGPGTVKLPPDSAKEYIRTRFGSSAVLAKTTFQPDPLSGHDLAEGEELHDELDSRQAGHGVIGKLVGVHQKRPAQQHLVAAAAAA